MDTFNLKEDTFAFSIIIPPGIHTLRIRTKKKYKPKYEKEHYYNININIPKR